MSELTQIRARNPRAIAAAAAARERPERPERWMVIAADHPARAMLAAS
jgi:hypothetical protein